MADVVGKTLDNALGIIKREDPDMILHVGSSSGYFVIGTPDEVRKELRTLSSKFREKYFNDYNKIMLWFASKAEDAIWDREEHPLVYAERIARISKAIMAREQSISRTVKFYTEFEELETRKVVKFYARFSEPGMALIVTGYETGLFWTRDEYLKSKEKVKKNGNKENKK